MNKYSFSNKHDSSIYVNGLFHTCPFIIHFPHSSHSDFLKNKSDHVITRLKTFQWLPTALRIIAVLLTCPLRSFMTWPLPDSLTTFPLTHSTLATLVFFQLCNMLSFLTTFAQAVSSVQNAVSPDPSMAAPSSMSQPQSLPSCIYLPFSHSAFTLFYIGDWIRVPGGGAILPKSQRMCKSLLGRKCGRGTFQAERRAYPKARGCERAQYVWEQ